MACCRRRSNSTAMRRIGVRIPVVFVLFMLMFLTTGTAFTIQPQQKLPTNQLLERITGYQRFTRKATTTTSTTALYAGAVELPDIKGMRVGEMKKELESYGINTKSFLEKKEIVAALEKARAEGKTPINGAAGAAGAGSSTVNGQTQSSSSSSTKTTDSSSSRTKTTSQADRPARLKEEMAKAKGMKVGELKKELQARGVSTKSFFEKSEFVKAYAEAIVDGVSKSSASSRLQPQQRRTLRSRIPRRHHAKDEAGRHEDVDGYRD